jgi:hypothetical protein
MPKPRKLKFYLLVLPFVLLLNSTGAMGQERCIVPTVPGEVKDIESYLKLQCDPANPEEIARNSSATIGVIGGAPPYCWEVAGKGFSMTPETMVPTNKLYADSTACGFADITVTEAHGEQVPCDVKCTSGQWSDWYKVADLRCSDVCAECEFCKVQFVGIEYIAKCQTERYRYRAPWQSGSGGVCPPGEACPDEPWWTGFCIGALSYRGCTVTICPAGGCDLGGGKCIVTLQEQEWGCGD